MRRTVVLLHKRHGFPDHFDWLIDQPDLNAEHRLITFRVVDRPDLCGSFTAQKSPDHRAIYLDYEGELSGGRGEVSRVAEGKVMHLSRGADELRATVKWDGCMRTYIAHCQDGVWLFASAD
jgi:hypothetical protein